jgi:hypothetical protein
LEAASGRDPHFGQPDPALRRQVTEVVEHAASDRQVEQVTAGERLRIDLDAVGAMVLQDDLRERNGVLGGAVCRDGADLDVVGSRHGGFSLLEAAGACWAPLPQPAAIV